MPAIIMKAFKALAAVVCVATVPAVLQGQSTSSAAASSGFPAIDEANLIARAHDLEAAGETSSTDALIASPSLLPDSTAAGVTYARRAVAVASWLQGDNNYAQAMLLAQRVEKTLAGVTEGNSRDHAERLYWEAQLQGRILDDKVEALSMLERVRAISPNDQRVIQLETEFANAVAAFGH